MKDGISRWFQHHLKACCEKGGCHGRWALIVGKECTVEMCFPDKWTWHMTTTKDDRTSQKELLVARTQRRH